MSDKQKRESTSLGKIIVKTRARERHEGAQLKGKINRDISEGWVRRRRGQGSRIDGKNKREKKKEDGCNVAIRHPRFISCSVSRGKLQWRSRFPLRAHFKRLRMSREWHSRVSTLYSLSLFFLSLAKFDLPVPHIVLLTCWRRVFTRYFLNSLRLHPILFLLFYNICLNTETYTRQTVRNIIHRALVYYPIFCTKLALIILFLKF